MYPPITSLQQLEQFAFAAFGLFVNREQGSKLKTACLLGELDLSKIPSSGRAHCAVYRGGIFSHQQMGFNVLNLKNLGHK